MHNLKQHFLINPAKHVAKMFQDEMYREYSKLASKCRGLPRHTRQHLNVFGYNFITHDPASFLWTFEEIFVRNSYSFRHTGTAPKILDLGANIGLSVLFFKMCYPEALIVAFEPDPVIFECLNYNVTNNQLSNVTLHQAAIWKEDGHLSFSADGADGGSLVTPESAKSIPVRAVSFSKTLESQDFDFLKMDIEGAENDVFFESEPYLDQFSQVFLEYHSLRSEDQKLPEILAILKEKGFRIHIQDVARIESPFVLESPNLAFDLQLNIFAKKVENNLPN